ncbi:hypothetical protein EW145_g454 [Phellinidium pouzarii]|uniref:Uncharacterized protein n=1 Tax=Phellinidium pouzarii TaxID=167371 RepID=A0A4V3XE03_9AGAM|nr:hypothetical protein EW145_g454 [Phellinidium pouzarii]
MSTTSTPADSPVHAEPLHNPARAAHVVVPQAPLGNATNAKIINQLPGMGAKALLAKKMAKTSNPKFISPTDNMMTPCSQKISAAKKKRFDKGSKPAQQQLFQSQLVLEESSESGTSGSEEEHEVTLEQKVEDAKMEMDDPENPF